MSVALLAMDFQRGVLARYPAQLGQSVLARLDRAMDAARSAGMPVIYVRLAFDERDRDISSRNLLFSPLVGLQEFSEGDVATEIHPAVRPRPGDFVVVKKRASAFCGSGLAQLVCSLGLSHLVLAGVATSGAVLSTVRDAADRDFALTVLSDACLDRDEKVHRVLCERVFPTQAAVSTVQDWVAAVTAEGQRH